MEHLGFSNFGWKKSPQNVNVPVFKNGGAFGIEHSDFPASHVRSNSFPRNSIYIVYMYLQFTNKKLTKKRRSICHFCWASGHVMTFIFPKPPRKAWSTERRSVFSSLRDLTSRSWWQRVRMGAVGRFVQFKGWVDSTQGFCLTPWNSWIFLAGFWKMACSRVWAMFNFCVVTRDVPMFFFKWVLNLPVLDPYLKHLKWEWRFWDSSYQASWVDLLPWK